MLKSTVIVLSFTLAAGSILFLGGFSSHVHAETGHALMPNDPAIVAQGAEIYDINCASCHGANLEGQSDWQIRTAEGRLPAPPHDETGHTWHHPDDILISITTHGTAALVGDGYQSDMVGFGNILTQAEIIAVLSYIKSTWSDEVIEIHDEINARAALGG